MNRCEKCGEDKNLFGECIWCKREIEDTAERIAESLMKIVRKALK
jgi:hypothetical protein